MKRKLFKAINLAGKWALGLKIWFLGIGPWIAG
jgi:hypothetical protein